MSKDREFQQFLRTSAIVVAIASFAAVSTVLVIDPYRLYGLVEMAGVNRVKPPATRYQKQIKLHGALTHQANILIVGNSRAELGLNPDHAVFSDGSPYNLALPGTRLGTGREQLERLSDANVRPLRILVGVEFLDFLMDPARPRTRPKARQDELFDDLAWQAEALFSIDSLVDSIKTLRIQRIQNPPSTTARGFNPLLEYNNFAREEGYFPIFQQRAIEYAKRLVRMPHGLINPATGTSPDIDDLREITGAAARAKADLHLIIYPYHAQLMGMFEHTGLDVAFEDWKAMLVREVSAARRANPDLRVTLWDFSGFSKFQCEAIPGKGDKTTQTQWYWEAGHFKPALGDLMLARILTDSAVPEGFGVALDASNVLANKVRIAQERTACEAAQPKLFADTRALIDAARASAQLTETF